MYKKILVALENSTADQFLLPHISQLAGLCRSRLILLHVADGWAARNFDQLQLAESEEMKEDSRYLEATAERLRKEASIEVEVRLALGSPPQKILEIAEEENCDLIAMTSHGHRLIGDLLLGSTIDKVRHRSRIPLLVVRGEGLGTGPLPKI
jgi:nucleotide-binding universal stress UspA family protein